VEADAPLLKLHCKLGNGEAPTLLLCCLKFVLQPTGGVGLCSSSVEFRLILFENDLPPLLQVFEDAVERKVRVRYAVKMLIAHITEASV
jgi:hypothetical protein